MNTERAEDSRKGNVCKIYINFRHVYVIMHEIMILPMCHMIVVLKCEWVM